MNSLNEATKESLIQQGWKIALAESLSAGLLQDLFVRQSGSSQYFLGGITAYTIEMKCKLLGVSPMVAEGCHGVSAEVAKEMALGVCQLFGADIGIATTGYAEPDKSQNIL